MITIPTSGARPAARHPWRCAAALLLLWAAAAAAEDARAVLDISPDWRFAYGEHQRAEFPDYSDSTWAAVNLPHTWNASDGQDGGGDYARGTGWYRRRLVIPAGWMGKRVFVTFQGANTLAEVYVNGVPVGRHVGGYAAFTFDITAQARVGVENVIAVVVSNVQDRTVPPLHADFTFGGGLYRKVALTATSAVHVSLTDNASCGVYLAQQRVSAERAEVAVRTMLRNDGPDVARATVQVEVRDAEGHSVAAVERQVALAGFAETADVEPLVISAPQLWQGRQRPYLYTAAVRVLIDGHVVDEVRQPLGLRSIAMDPQRGFLLNGQPYDLHGTSLHQGRWGKGFAVDDADIDQDLALLGDLGATFVRLAHYQHAQRTYRGCDQAGIVAWAEIPCVMQVNPDPRFAESCRRQLIELIRQNYNHPAICCWGLFNEIPGGPAEQALVKDLVELARTEDPSRPATGASFAPSAAPINHLTGVIGFNEYYGWFIPNYGLFGTWADGFHAAYPGRAFGLSEYGAGGSVHVHVEHPDQPLLSVLSINTTPHSEEYLSQFHEAVWPQLASRPFLWCKSLWTLCDFPSDSQPNGICDMGLVTADRAVRKDAYFYYQAQWSALPVLHLAERRFVKRPRAAADVTLYSNLAQVGVTVNGAALPARAAQGGVVRWVDVPLHPGANVVEALGSGPGGAALSDRLVWMAP